MPMVNKHVCENRKSLWQRSISNTEHIHVSVSCGCSCGRSEWISRHTRDTQTCDLCGWTCACIVHCGCRNLFHTRSKRREVGRHGDHSCVSSGQTGWNLPSSHTRDTRRFSCQVVQVHADALHSNQNLTLGKEKEIMSCNYINCICSGNMFLYSRDHSLMMSKFYSPIRS